jgi:NADH dehydrogenase
VTPVIGPGTQRLQPIWVDDLARAVALALDRDNGSPLDRLIEAPEMPVELGGPDVIDWNGLWHRLKALLGARRPAVHLPVWLARAQASLLERLPNPPLTRDQITMMELGDNVVSRSEGMADLGLTNLVPLDEQLRRAVVETGTAPV